MLRLQRLRAFPPIFRNFVDVPDTTETRPFFQEFKERLKTRFRQIDIWMTSHPSKYSDTFCQPTFSSLPN